MDKQKAPAQAPVQQPASTSVGASPSQGTGNGSRLGKAGLGSIPYPRAGSSIEIQGFDGFDADALAALIVADTVASTGEQVDGNELREELVRVLLNQDAGRSGTATAFVGTRSVRVSVVAEVRNSRSLKRGEGTVSGSESSEGSITATDSFGATLGLPGASNLGGSRSDARTSGRAYGSSLTLEALQDLMRGDIWIGWDIYHEHSPRAAPGVHPLVSAIGANINASLHPPDFATGGSYAGTLTYLQLVDE